MNDSSLHPLARDYSKRLKKAAASLPRARRAELLEEIEAHLSEALPPGAGEAEALNVLERLGEPAQIVAEAESGLGARAGMREWLAIPLLLLGGFALLIGWCVGVALLWNSRIWTARDKLIGTFVLPGGLSPVLFAAAFVTVRSSVTGRVCEATPNGSKCHDVVSSSGGSHVLGIALLVALLVLPILSAIYLAWRANSAEAAT